MRRKLNPESQQSEIELDLYESPQKPISRRISRPQQARVLEEEVLLVNAQDDDKPLEEVFFKLHVSE